MQRNIELLGYDLIGQGGRDGIRYAWKREGTHALLESAAFTYKTKGVNNNISGYTTSVSMGCILKSERMACKFCRTGAILPFSGILSAYDIAKQNILMVLKDIQNTSESQLNLNEREFAYMGQGEPGYSYTQLRLAIKMTDYVMDKLGQKVYRHIISTSGIPEMICAVCDDMKRQYYNSRITMHFSLHSVSKRKQMMPIDIKYPYEEVLKSLKMFSEITGEKVCIGMLLFNKFNTKKEMIEYTTSRMEIEQLLDKIDKEHFRISLCEYNNSSDVGMAEQFKQSKMLEYYEYIRKEGYEVKLFSSFGQEENTACGMLGGQMPNVQKNRELQELELYADELLQEAYTQMIS